MPNSPPESSALRAAILSLLLAALFAGCGTSEPAGNPSPEAAGAATVPGVSAGTQRVESKAETLPAVPRDPQPDDWFEDVTARAGVGFTYHSGRDAGQYTLLETVGGGVALLDYDRDGDLDLFFAGGGRISVDPDDVNGLPPALFRNDGDWKFVDVTREANLGDPGAYSHGCAVADFDRDGYPDVFVTCYGRNRLFHNQQNGTFKDVAKTAGLDDNSWSTAAAWGDVNRDGFADLYVAAYVDWSLEKERQLCGTLEQRKHDTCPPNPFRGAQDRLYLNRGNGTFENASRQAALSDRGMGLGVVAADVNEDGWLDFYVANDLAENHLYLGGSQLPFQNAGLTAGVESNEFGLPEGSMGVDFSDVDGDGLGELWVTNFEMEDNSLYKNGGGGRFTHATLAFGLGGQSRLYVGWATGWFDFDADGWLDLFVINGNVFYHTGQGPYRQPSFVYRNLSGSRMTDVSAKAGPYFSTTHVGRGAAVGDLDNDGALDLVVVHQDEPVAVLRNRLAPPHWVRAQLLGRTCDPDAVGAYSLKSDDRQIVKFVRGGAGYLSHNDSRILFPLPNDRPATLTVRWPQGDVEVFPDLAPNKTHELIEGTGQKN